MERLFDEARHKRRNAERVFTSRVTNVRYYGSPALAEKKSIWPPLSRQDATTGGETAGPDFNSNAHHARATPPAMAPRNSTRTRNAPESILNQYMSDANVLYHALHSGSVIRVLEIEVGSFVDPVRCKFHYADLDDLHLDYDALSYVWNKPRFASTDEDMRKAKVWCQGHELRISQNLEQAIRHIRSSEELTFLWADALCINQDDTTERGHQVTLMASIYRRAQRTVVWLGDALGSELWDYTAPPELEDIKAERAFGAVCDIVNRWLSLRDASPGKRELASYRFANPDWDAESREFSHFDECPFSLTNSGNQADLQEAMILHGLVMSGQALEDRNDNQLKDLHVSDSEPVSTRKERTDLGLDASEELAPRSPLWGSVASLFSCSWFWRIWVIQEVTLAQSAVAKWGHAEIDWKWIGLASAILRTNYNHICNAMKMSGVYNAYFMFRLSPMSDLTPLSLSFIQLLRLTRQFEVTDVRDRVYGLLGIRTSDNDPDKGALYLEPDYSISDCELWKRLATKAICESRNLSLLSSVQFTTGGLQAGYSPETDIEGILSRDRFPSQPLPSWVPHWDIVYRATLAPWDDDDRFAAAKGFPLSLNSPAGADNLVVEGIQIGVVGRCGRYMWHQADISFLETEVLGGFFASDGGLRLLAHTLTAGRNAHGSLVDSGGGDNSLADLAAYILDCDRNDRDARRRKESRSTRRSTSWVPIRARSCQTAFQRHPDLEERLERLAVDGDASRFYSSVIPLCERRRLFITLNGYIGLGSDSVREGDVVCVLSGADLPFVLRRIRVDNAGADESIHLASDQISPADHYVLVGECYMEGLMNGEAVAAVEGHAAEFSGPVPYQLLEEDILSTANRPEKVVTQGLVAEIQRTKMKQARLDEGDLFTPAMLEVARRNKTEKRWFDIH